MKAREIAKMLPEKCTVRIRQESERVWHRMPAAVLVNALEGDYTVKSWRNTPDGTGYNIIAEDEIFKH